MVQDYGGGPFKTAESPIHDRPYLVPAAAEEGVTSYAYCDATLIGSISVLAGGPKLPVTTKPILLVHGWYKDPFSPYTTWQAMTEALTGKDPTDPADYTIIYNPSYPGNPNYALRRCEGAGRVVLISNYTRDSSQPTNLDIRTYAYALQDDVALATSNEASTQIDIIAHSMGGLVVRSYVEAADFSAPPHPTAYQDDIRKLITMGTPHQGSFLADIWPDLVGWISLNQMEHGSDFLNELNVGTTGATLNVEYSSIAGNYYSCPPSPFFAPALAICILSGGQENDGATAVPDTELAYQAGVADSPAARWWILDLDHTALRGSPGEICYSATAIKVILAGWTYQDWLNEGRPT